jgi:hypothetical protein
MGDKGFSVVWGIRQSWIYVMSQNREPSRFHPALKLFLQHPRLLKTREGGAVSESRLYLVIELGE